MESTNPRILTGVVTSNKANKTITVKIERKVKHPYMGKLSKELPKFMHMMKITMLQLVT